MMSLRGETHNYVLEKLPVELPQIQISEQLDFQAIVVKTLENFPRLIDEDFTDNAVWRDSMALSGTFRTFYSGKSITTAWQELCRHADIQTLKLNPSSVRIIKTPANNQWLSAEFNFVVMGIPSRECIGSVSLIPTRENEWKIWMMTTVLDQLIGHPRVDQLTPDMQDAPGQSQHDVVRSDKSDYFDVVIVGAGQAGLAVAGRVKALNVSYVVIDKMQKIGDNWLLRYDSTRLHTPREFAHLPFKRTFPPTFQEYLDKYDISNGFKQWVREYKINVQLSTSLENGTWDEKRELYTLKINRNGKEATFTCRHVVMATGGYGPHIYYPKYENEERFKGIILHSSNYRNMSQWKGKNGIVIGSANTAHDIVDDMEKAGFKSVTMVQRGTTYVLPVEQFKKFSDILGSYNSDIPTEVADRLSYSTPWAVSRLYTRSFLHHLASQEPERFESLERAGFNTERYGDLTYQLTVRRGGHYIDVGCSSKIARGLIKMKSTSPPTEYTEQGLKFADGSHVEADVVVFATGFSGNMREVVEATFGSQTAQKTDLLWGLDDEGELRGAFKPTGQPGLWYAAGTLGHTRWGSRFIALQIRADLDGTPFPVYNGK
ncbi:dimethylaniline monooxygenase (N-oxide forming) [Xylogone sp. PMI_703]|nr:dimethylaniline monooxygenase (N-oxide forming) [Xylogone sp. PMI_703]